MWLYIIIAIITVILIAFLVTYNSFVRLNNQVKEAFSTMDVYLKKRWDLIPNIVETVKGIVDLRNSIKLYDNLSSEEKIKTNEEIASGLGKLMVLAESYPELKAADNFKNLSKELSKVEDEIANSRKYYNAVVKNFNNKVEMIPSNIIAKILGYKTKKMFEATSEEKENIKVEI